MVGKFIRSYNEASSISTDNDIGDKTQTLVKKYCVDRSVMLVGLKGCE